MYQPPCHRGLSPPLLLHTFFTGDILNALANVSGQKHPSTVQGKQLKVCLPMMPMVLHLVMSQVLTPGESRKVWAVSVSPGPCQCLPPPRPLLCPFDPTCIPGSHLCPLGPAYIPCNQSVSLEPCLHPLDPTCIPWTPSAVPGPCLHPLGPTCVPWTPPASPGLHLHPLDPLCVPWIPPVSSGSHLYPLDPTCVLWTLPVSPEPCLCPRDRVLFPMDVAYIHPMGPVLCPLGPRSISWTSVISVR